MRIIRGEGGVDWTYGSKGLYGGRIPELGGELPEGVVQVPRESRNDSNIVNNLLRSQSSNSVLREQEWDQKCGNTGEQHDDDVIEKRGLREDSKQDWAGC